MSTQKYPDSPTLFGKLAGVATVAVSFQAARVVLCDGGYRVVPGTDVWDSVVVPAYRMAGHLERHIAENYPGLTLVDWEVK